MTINQAIGEKVHTLMWRQGVTQERMAVELGVTQAAISKKVRGKRPFSVEELLRTAVLLRTSISELLAGVKLPHLDSNQEPIGHSRLITPIGGRHRIPRKRTLRPVAA